MTVEGKIEANGEGIIYIHSGTLDGEQLPDKTRAHYDSFDTSKLRYQIMDFRAVDRIEMSSDEIRQTAELFVQSTKQRRPDHKFAIVIGNEPMFAIMKLWETYLADPDVRGRIFYSMEAARTWIDDDTSEKSG